ncbi:MAG: ATP phosphoribosyltransferase [Alphaproteobacteria bacterium]|nr:ATP phosphoribosyltransferase [Alphaproteobacteria bacterium]
MSGLVLAVPSKGRIQEGAIAFLREAGLDIARDPEARDYLGRIASLPGVEVRFLSASEIASQLESGAAHIGITGEDLLREQTSDFDSAVALLRPLGFARADVVVAAPQSWIDVQSMADLDDVCLAFRARHHRHLRVATKYVALTRSFFAAHGVSDYRIVESFGATEGAPAAGTAEIIVDITSTGQTLAANRLKVLRDGVILRSQAHLAASLRARWTDGALSALGLLLDRIAARADADGLFEVRVVLPAAASKRAEALAAEFGCEALVAAGTEEGGKAAEAGGVHHAFLCPGPQLHPLSLKLRQEGASIVRAMRVDYVFRSGDRVLDAFRARITPVSS